MRPRLVFLVAMLSAAAALAQAQPPLQREPNLPARKNQKIERLHVEDAANRIDELRVGGETQNVTVQPKADMPAYEIQPNDMARSRPSDSREGLAARKQRVWNVLQF